MFSSAILLAMNFEILRLTLTSFSSDTVFDCSNLLKKLPAADNCLGVREPHLVSPPLSEMMKPLFPLYSLSFVKITEALF